MRHAAPRRLSARSSERLEENQCRDSHSCTWYSSCAESQRHSLISCSDGNTPTSRNGIIPVKFEAPNTSCKSDSDRESMRVGITRPLLRVCGKALRCSARSFQFSNANVIPYSLVASHVPPLPSPGYMALVPSNSCISGETPAPRAIFSSRFIAMRYVSLPMTTVRVHISPPPLGLQQNLEHSRASESNRRVIWPSCSAATEQTTSRQSTARGAISDGRKIFWERIARWQRSRRPREPNRPP